MSNRPTKGVLSDHKRAGKRLIPPLMQLPNVLMTSFREEKLPQLVWLSALFRRTSDRSAVRMSIEFLMKCHEIVGRDDARPLLYLGNFRQLSDTERTAIKAATNDHGYLSFLTRHLQHQRLLFPGYPLDFLFDADDRDTAERDISIAELGKDVDLLLDRGGDHATKVQVTALVALMATKKLFLSSQIDFPDPNCIFTAADSDDARRVASFARATLNSGIEADDEWPREFWIQAFRLIGCTHHESHT